MRVVILVVAFGVAVIAAAVYSESPGFAAGAALGVAFGAALLAPEPARKR